MGSHISKILVPIDFSDQSIIALSQSYNLAREYNADIALLHVIEDSGALGSIFSSQQDESLRKDIQVKLDELASGVEKKTKRKVETLIARGKAYEKIAEVAQMLDAIFIIMGCSAVPHGIKGRFIGSNALRVVRESSIPVISVKGKHHRDGCKNIVLPLDLTKETREKVSKAIEIAKLGNRAAIRVVSVLFTTDEFVVNRLTRQLSQVKNFIEKEGVECTAEIIKGSKGEDSLAKNIIDYANKVEGDLIMIMTQQEVDFTEFFIGSSAQEIILNSDIPVLSIVPSPKKDLSHFAPY